MTYDDDDDDDEEEEVEDAVWEGKEIGDGVVGDDIVEVAMYFIVVDSGTAVVFAGSISASSPVP